MAVAWVSPSAESHTGTTGSANEASFTWNITPSAAPRWAVVFVMNRSSTTQQVTSVTYDGVTMGAIASGEASDAAGEPGCIKAWFLDNIPANTTQRAIVVNRNNNADILYGACIIGSAAGACEVTGVQTAGGDGTLAEINVDDGSPGTNSLRLGGLYTGLASPPNAGANSTTMAAIDFGNLGCSTVRETTPGQGSRPVGWSNGTSDDRAAVYFAVREAAGGESHSGTLVVTGGGVLTAALTTNRNRSGSLVGGGVLAFVKATARNLAQLLTGGGVDTQAQTTNRNRAQLLTGGGVLSWSASAASGGAENHDGTFVLTGGGRLVVAASEGATRAAILTGGGVINWAELTGRLAAVQLTGGGQLVIMGGQDVALSDLGAVMCAIGDALEAADVGGGRVFCYPPDSIDAPACVVGYPSVIEFDATMQRGADRLVIPVYFLTGRTSDRAAQQRIAGVITGAAGVKDAVDGNLGGAVDTARVQDMRVLRVDLAGVEYLSAVFNVEAYV